MNLRFDETEAEPKIIIPFNKETEIIYETLVRIARRIIRDLSAEQTA